MRVSILILLTLSVIVLTSIASNIFPQYFVYIILSIIAFWFFSKIGFETTSIFSTHLYIFSIFLLVITILIGSVTRGAIRWIPIGSFSLQPGELIRPFLLVFFAKYLTQKEVSFNILLKSILLLIIPVFLILIQPSLGVSILTVIGFVGILFASDFNKKYLITGVFALILVLPLLWLAMVPYQKQRLLTFIEPSNDPLGSGYNSVQSTIAVGSGKVFGRGLGKGVQTQLSFLPEKQTDFIFAATGEELGFVGVFILLTFTFIIFIRLSFYMENAVSPTARAYLSGLFLTLFTQVFVHIGMNLGILPITGLPYPLVSSGGSSLLATMTALGIARSASKK